MRGVNEDSGRVIRTFCCQLARLLSLDGTYVERTLDLLTIPPRSFSDPLAVRPFGPNVMMRSSSLVFHWYSTFHNILKASRHLGNKKARMTKGKCLMPIVAYGPKSSSLMGENIPENKKASNIPAQMGAVILLAQVQS